ncbi:DMT family transporter [Salipaludibacillus daqingensis]|uniref:DMT family transporter n=1 Tax=Salipaludibacillus daqingensis TaxID=3041001 RepID=UPI002476BC78|nr:DMT family transporter [Salipaludibacillus daqingensis]
MRIHPYIFLTIAMLFFSGNFIVGKAFEGTIPPITLAFFRFATGSLVLLPLCYKTLIKKLSLWRKEWKPLLSLSIFGIVLFNASLYLAVNYTSSINASIVDALTPTVAAILGFIVLKESLTKLQIVGIILSFAGILSIISNGSWHVITSLSFNIGDIIMLFGIICWASYSIIIKKHSYKFPPIAGLVVTMIIGTMILMPFALIESYYVGFPNIFQQHILLGIAYIGIFPSAISLLLWYRGVGEIGPAKASIFFNLVPVFTTIMAITILNEKMTYPQLFGGAIVLCGVYLSTKSQKKFHQKAL